MPHKKYSSSIREGPHAGDKFGAMAWHPVRNGDTEFRNGDGYDYTMPDYVSGYTGHMPTNLRTSYERNGKKYDGGRCPLKAYPLSCSENGSPCLDYRCDDPYVCCCRKQSHCYGDHGSTRSFGPPEYQRSQPAKPRSSNACCSACCESGSKYNVAKTSNKACCDSCSKGGSCEDEKEYYKTSRKSSKACSTSCSKGGWCEEGMNYSKNAKSSSGTCCSSCSRGGPCKDKRKKGNDRPPCCRFKFREVTVMPHRKCGVISNYMGHIPGLQMSFGESYGITANRLLQKHFSEQEKKHY